MIAVLLAIWATLWIAGDTPVGRLLQRWLVAKPAARLARISRMQVVLVLLLMAIGLGALGLLGHDGLSLYGMAMPELTALLASVEVTGFIDAAIAMTLAATSVQWRALVQRLHGGRARSVRTRRAERPAPSNDDEHPAVLRLAA